MFDFLLKFYRSKNIVDKTQGGSQNKLTEQSDDRSQPQELAYPSMWREIQQIAHPITFNALKDFYKVR